MHFRTAELKDVPAITNLYRTVARVSGTLARSEDEINESIVQHFVEESLASGLIIVGEDEKNPGVLIAELHGYKDGIRAFDHVLSNITCMVHPDYQGKKVGRTMFTIFLEEVATNRPDIGKVELFTGEENQAAIRLYQSMGFDIEGRLEMRFRTTDDRFLADIVMGWINPGFEFDGNIPRLQN